MSGKVMKLVVTELFDELREENNRLSNDLQYANKCLSLLDTYRNYLTECCVNCKCVDNDEMRSKFTILENDYNTIIQQRIDSDADNMVECEKRIENNDNCYDEENCSTNSVNSSDVTHKSVIDVQQYNNNNIGISRINFIRNSRITDKKAINGFKFIKPSKKQLVISDCNIELKTDFTNNCCVNDMDVYIDNSRYVVSDQLGYIESQPQQPVIELINNDDNTSPHATNVDMLKAIEMIDMNGCKRYRCPYPNCNTDYAGVHRVRSHMYSVHTNHRPFKCSECEKGFTRSDYLAEHMNSVHSTTIYACDWNGCTFETKNYKRLNKHKLRHTGYQLFRCEAEHCAKGYYSKSALERHSNAAHKPFAPRLYNCDWPQCGLTFASLNELRCHTRGRHVERELRACEWPGCEASFKTTSALNVHVSSRHTGEKPFKCDWPGCEFAFINRSAMRKHIIVHSELKNFECNWPECGKKFRTKYSLKIHTRVHCGERPFKCEWPQCSRGYTVNSKLLRHYRTHTNQ